MALVSNLHTVFGILGCAAGLFYFFAPMMKDNETHNINGPADSLIVSNPTSAWSSFESFVYKSIETESFINYVLILPGLLVLLVRNKGRWCRGLEAAALCLVLTYGLWVVAKLFNSFELMELSIFFLFLVILIMAYISFYGILYPEDENESNREQLERLLLVPQAEASTAEQPTAAEKK